MRVQVISAYPAIRSGLAALLRAQPGWTVVGETAPDALAPASPPPDVALFDLETAPDAETFARWLDLVHPAGGVVLLLPERSRGALDGGVRGLGQLAATAETVGAGLGALGRDATVEEIVAAIAAVGAGLLALDRRQAAALWAPQEPVIAGSAHAAATPGDEQLTPRERDVLQLLAEGLPNKLIAQRLQVSDHTVKFHVSSIMLKLNAASRTEAVTVAARRGLLIL